VDAPTATWKVILLGIIAALLIALGAGASVLPDPSNSVDAYQQATPCSAASIPSDNCYTVVPVTVVTASAHHFHKNRQDEEHVIVQAPSGPSEIVLPWESHQNPVVQKAQTRWIGWILLGLGLVFAGAVVLTLLARRRRVSVTVPSTDALRQAIVQLPPDADPRVVEEMNEIQQHLATMQAQPRRGQITRGQTIGIVIGCAVAVLGALLLRGLH
jgi:hypothetical protein